jgi:hypothetical protein
MKEIIGSARNNDWLRRRLCNKSLKFIQVKKLEINFSVCPQF